jgi:hypothetical protein
VSGVKHPFYEENRKIGYVSADDAERGHQDGGFYDDKFHDPSSRGRLAEHHIKLGTWLHHTFPGHTFGECGGGRSWLIKILLAYGEDAVAFDISEWAVANSPIHDIPAHRNRVWVGDVTKDRFDPPRDIVICHNVLGYLYNEEEVDAAFENLTASFTKCLYLGIVTIENWLQAKKVGCGANNSRAFLRPKSYWDAKKKKHGLVLASPKKQYPAIAKYCFEKRGK